jgi:hypothetical protein
MCTSEQTNAGASPKMHAGESNEEQLPRLIARVPLQRDRDTEAPQAYSPSSFPLLIPSRSGFR